MRFLLIFLILLALLAGCVTQTPTNIPITPASTATNTPVVVVQASVVVPTSSPSPTHSATATVEPTTPSFPTPMPELYPHNAMYPSQVAVSLPTDIPIDQATIEDFPAFPPQDQYVEVLTTWLNSDPSHINQLETLLHYWDESRFLRHGTLKTGLLRKADLNADFNIELYITLYPTEIVRIERLNDHYLLTPATIPTNVGGDLSIWAIEDVNSDGIEEIILEWNRCGAHTCYSAPLILQWSEQGLIDLVDSNTTYEGLKVPQASIHWFITQPAHLDIIGGQIGSVSGGTQRDIQAHYVWDGYIYRLDSIRPLPDNPIPYWALQDGARLIRVSEFYQAQRKYWYALNEPYHQDPGATIDNLQAKTRAAARTQLVWLAINANKLETAEIFYQESQKLDGEFAILSKTLWETYQQTKDLHTACEITRREAEKIRYPYTDIQPLNLTSVVCVEPEK